ncbi:hypothetical protein AAEX63_07255 [Luteococcus sp. H138]|uniref:glucosylglycerate hydrolase n=1 Tax=unclassified Luteococcus TaxID=2639923 RepID=UPI00313B105A
MKPDTEMLQAAALEVLRANDTGTMVTAAPKLYPHQWSWDAAFVSIGLAHVSVERAITEWKTIFDAQWSTGMLPHIVFGFAPDYFPGFAAWGTDVAKARPDGIETSGICQPPVHALCVELVCQIGLKKGGEQAELARAFMADALPRLARWHDWLSSARDREGLGVIEIHHGWESGMDNSPRFDPIYDRVQVAEPKMLPRTDLKHADPAERPSDREYQRYIWLIDQMISVEFDDDRIPDVIDFRCGDIFMTACLAASADALARMASSLGDGELAARERTRAGNYRSAVASSIAPETGLCRDYDYTEGHWLDIESIAGFSMLVCGGDEALVTRQREIIRGLRWMGHPRNLHPLPGSISLDDPACRPREYWRGPVWPIMNWLLSYCATQNDDVELAGELRTAGLAQLGDLQFGEYYEPCTGEPLGSHQQSWTAMAAIDWLDEERWP